MLNHIELKIQISGCRWTGTRTPWIGHWLVVFFTVYLVGVIEFSTKKIQKQSWFSSTVSSWNQLLNLCICGSFMQILREINRHSPRSSCSIRWINSARGSPTFWWPRRWWRRALTWENATWFFGLLEFPQCSCVLLFFHLDFSSFVSLFLQFWSSGNIPFVSAVHFTSYISNYFLIIL